jgi:hypothetical protein
VSSDLAQILAIMVVEKSRPKFFTPKPVFSAYFLLKTPIKYFKNHNKPIYDLKKKIKKSSQKLKSIRNKKSH